MPRKPGYSVQCSVEGCRNIEVARGYCNKHYLNWKHHGHPEAKHPEFSNRQLTIRERLEQQSVRIGGCWLWPFGITKNGYGRIVDGSVRKLAHRAAYEVFIGAIPDGLTIDHVCHNTSDCSDGFHCVHRRCVNPDHLEAVTMDENRRRAPNIGRRREEAR